MLQCVESKGFPDSCLDPTSRKKKVNGPISVFHKEEGLEDKNLKI